MSKVRSNQEWEEDYDETTYDKQYADDDASDGVQLNFNTLYVTNIPKVMTREGLQNAFRKYGTVVRTFLSYDPQKRYALITYESPNEAKVAMMKLNKAEPLNLNVNVSHSTLNKKFASSSNDNQEKRPRDNTQRDRGSYRDESGSVGSYGKYKKTKEEVVMATVDNDYDDDVEEDLGLEMSLDPDLHLELERLKLEHLKLQEAQVQCKQRMLLLNSKKPSTNMTSSVNRSILPDGRIVVRNNYDKNADVDVGAGAGDSKERETVCSCKAKVGWWNDTSSSDGGTSTPSTCVLCSEDRSDTQTQCQDKSVTSRTDTRKTRTESKYDAETNVKSVASKVTDLTSKQSEYSKITDASKPSDLTSKRVVRRHKSSLRLQYSDLYSDSEPDVDDTKRLIELRSTDYLDIVEDHLKVVVALAGYPKSKMTLQLMELFQKTLNDIMDMQLKNGLLKKAPTFLDYYLNRGAVVCICNDLETRDWVVRITPGLQERMSTNLILLKAKVKRLCLAITRIPHGCWPKTARDAFKLLQYFNPSLRTHLWRIYSQKTIGGVECTSFILDRVSGEIIRGPTFKNIIDYSQIDFELSGYSEIYYECLLSEIGEDLRSIASRVKLLEELRSNESTPRNSVMMENETMTIGTTKKDEPEKEKDDSESEGVEVEYIIETSSVRHEVELNENETSAKELKKDLENSVQKDILTKLKDVKYISDKDEVIVWADENNTYESLQEINVQSKESETDYVTSNAENTYDVSKSPYVDSENTESIYDSFETLLSRDSNVNIDSNRGMAYYRRTNYLHVENELKTAITLAGYPQNKLEGTHIRRLKQLFKEYLHKDMKSQRFANLIIPKFQDVYLSNGAVIYICDSLETMDYLNEVLPKLINTTGLKLVFRDVKDLVRYTRTVMRLPEKLAHVESVDILNKLKLIYPNLKPDCWKYYSDVAGKQKRQFGVDPESLEVLRRPDFDPVYEGEKISFRIIDRRKRDVSFNETTTKETVEIENVYEKKFKDKLLKHMYCPIDTDVMNTPLTRARTNHYTDLIPDDWKLYVGPSNYPETRIDEPLFHTIKRTFENVVFETINESNLDSIPKIHDMYLFDGVIFVICKDMDSRKWIENNLNAVNSKIQTNLKATEFRGAVGIVSMAVATSKDTDEVIAILQKQNPRLRTKFWRKISTVRSIAKLDVVLQIDKLSAQVINEKNFNNYIGKHPVQFTLGHLKSLIKTKASIEEMCKKREVTDSKAKKNVTQTNSDQIKPRNIDNKIEVYNQDNKFYISQKDVDPKIIIDTPKTYDELFDTLEADRDYCRLILKIPKSISPQNKDDLNIIFELLQDKNPGLNTELWRLTPETNYSSGRFTVLVDVQSATVIRGKDFDPYLAGEKLTILCSCP